MTTRSRKRRLQTGSAFACVLPLMLSGQSKAVEFSFLDNQLSGSLDTTVSYGALWRVQGQDKTNNDVNSNDGNRNFSTGLASEVYKITSDLEATYQNYGLFMRGSAFYDTQIMDKRNDYYDHNDPPQPSQSYPHDDHFTDATRDTAGHRAEILDAYLYGNWDIADHPLSARLGNQVFNWGEGVFYRGGINTTNPVDAAKFRLPGSELKEVLMPVEAVSFNVGLTDNLSMDAFYQWNWKETRLDPAGTFFSETDLFADGGNTGYTRVKALSDPLFQTLYPQLSASHFAGLQGTDYLDSNGYFKVSHIGQDINAKNDGQFGVAFHYIAEQLNSTEFGFYFVNYHAKDPVIYADLNKSYAGLDMDQLAQLVGSPSYDALVQSGGQMLGLVNAAAAVDMANQANARREYVENIRMYGLSFNTTLGDASLFGEIAYRPNLPIGVATTNDLLGDMLAQAGKIADGQKVNVGGQMVGLGGAVHDYERVESFNSSLGTIYNFGPSLSFDSFMGVFEVAAEQLRGSSLQYTAYDGSTRYYSGRSNGAYVSGFDRGDQVNRNAYGATLLLTGTWNDVFAGVNLSPYGVYKDDFSGNSQQAGNFIAGRKAYTLGLKATYLNSLEAELQYTEFYGAGQENAARDRDNVGFNVKYSF
ncbi:MULTISPECIES: DUF1302 domain-containing protein [Pseudomonas]|uniref:DUF1302 domain-containing protein n=1 Tax=Pseudomonas nitroreducens TaxID=46680 RepID=UPI001E33A4ED|nr:MULTISPECIES: DUF1302 domain-containing protein [Pseudomonas]MCE4070513.1 DUF1302 domain-containing protein [Pseudomonas nitritireducens]MCE4080617.1 DUF1302 domain-containing protein [Pseudomonas nitroreducens]